MTWSDNVATLPAMTNSCSLSRRDVEKQRHDVKKQRRDVKKQHCDVD